MNKIEETILDKLDFRKQDEYKKYLFIYNKETDEKLQYLTKTTGKSQAEIIRISVEYLALLVQKNNKLKEN